MPSMVSGKQLLILILFFNSLQAGLPVYQFPPIGKNKNANALEPPILH
jgi:hypothetical protein